MRLEIACRPEQVKSYDIFSEVGYYIFVVVCGDACDISSVIALWLAQLTAGPVVTKQLLLAFIWRNRLTLHVMHIRCTSCGSHLLFFQLSKSCLCKLWRQLSFFFTEDQLFLDEALIDLVDVRASPI